MFEKVEIINVSLSDLIFELGDPISPLLLGLAVIHSDFIDWENQLEGVEGCALTV
jgi:hypothetical protein